MCFAWPAIRNVRNSFVPDRSHLASASIFRFNACTSPFGSRPNVDRLLHRNSEMLERQRLLLREVARLQKCCARLPQDRHAAFEQLSHSSEGPGTHRARRGNDYDLPGITERNFRDAAMRVSQCHSHSCERFWQRTIRFQIQQRAAGAGPCVRIVRGGESERGKRAQARSRTAGGAHEIAPRYFHSVPAMSRSMSAAVSKNC